MALTRVGGDLLKRPLNIGAGVTITTDGNATFSGIVTASSFVDSAGNPISGGGAGIGSALSSTPTNPLNSIYYVNNSLNITQNTTIDVPDTALLNSDGFRVAYTNFEEVIVFDTYDLIVSDGNELQLDVLSLRGGF